MQCALVGSYFIAGLHVKQLLTCFYDSNIYVSITPSRVRPNKLCQFGICVVAIRRFVPSLVMQLLLALNEETASL